MEVYYFYGAVSNSYSVCGMQVLDKMGVEFDDGRSELVRVEMFKTPAQMAALAHDMIHQSVAGNKLVTIRHCKHVKFMFDEPMPFTLDGEFGGEHTEVEVETLEHAARIIIQKPEWVSLEDEPDFEGAPKEVEEK